METAAELRAEGRAHARAQVRDLALDATRAVVLEHGWTAVRMGDVARRIGTSRQSLHGEFGTKDELGAALVAREAGYFLAGVREHLEAHPGDLAGAVHAAVDFTLAAAAANPLLQAILAGGQTSDDVTLLPMLTSRSEPILEAAVELFDEWAGVHAPDVVSSRRGLLVESVVRLLLSHVVVPTADPDVVADAITRVAVALAAADPLPG